MFWRVSGLNTVSPVDAILEKDHFTLEELLDEDELIQECKSLNARLTAYLKQVDTVEKLLAYMVDEPPEDADAKRQFKYPFSACEIFCCEVEGIFNTLLENDALLERLFGILRRPRPLNSMLAGYFARVVGSLLLRRSSDTMQYLQRENEFLSLLVGHVDTTSVAEVLVRLMGADDPRGYGVAGTLDWLEDTDLLQLLVRQLGPNGTLEAQANAAEVLAAVARSTGSPLTRKMARSEFMHELVEAALAPHEGQAATHALNVCIALLEPPSPQDQTLGLSLGGSQDENLQEEVRAEAVRCIASATDRLVAILDHCDMKELRTSYGRIKPPVGQLRLKAVDLLATLLRTAEPAAEKAVMASQGVQRAMALFLQYPFNNALHGSVAALLTAFEPGSDALRSFLLNEAGLVDWLISAPEEIRPVVDGDDASTTIEARVSDDEVTPEEKEDGEELSDNGTARSASAMQRSSENASRQLRAGYCGHLTQVANRLLHLRESCPIIREYLDSHEGWKEYVANRLEPRNRIESVFAWRCGRPATHTTDIGSDAIMYQNDLTFASMDAGSFAKEVYQHYGGVYEGDEDDEQDTKFGDGAEEPESKQEWGGIVGAKSTLASKGYDGGLENPSKAFSSDSNRHPIESYSVSTVTGGSSGSSSDSEGDSGDDEDERFGSKEGGMRSSSKDSESRTYDAGKFETERESDDVVIVKGPEDHDVTEHAGGTRAKSDETQSQSQKRGGLRGLDLMDDMQDDAVMMDDFEAAEGLMDLHHGMGKLHLSNSDDDCALANDSKLEDRDKQSVIESVGNDGNASKEKS